MRTELPSRHADEKDIKRLCNLTKASNGNGAHGQALTGIRVAFDLTCTNKLWVEAERYRFLEFVSSQSTMHRITKFDLSKQYNKYVDPRVIDIMQEKVDTYNKWIKARDQLDPKLNEELLKVINNFLTELYLEILYTNPAGFTLTARLTTNYRCLKNIWRQRRHHRLPEWREFCKWIESLPYAKELICYEEKE
jgi:hypothetical protein